MNTMKATVFHGANDIRIWSGQLIAHRFSLDEIPQAYQLFGERTDGVFKVAVKS